MSREMQKGSEFEQDVSDYLSAVLGDDRIERRAKNGKNDRGDITGLMVRGSRCVVECKNCKRTELADWVEQAEVERGNDDAEYGVVVHKRRGYGRKRLGGSYVTMTLETFAAIVAGGHGNLEAWDDDAR